MKHRQDFGYRIVMINQLKEKLQLVIAMPSVSGIMLLVVKEVVS